MSRQVDGMIRYVFTCHIVQLYWVMSVDQKMFSDRLVELRMQKGVSARDMSLSIGQSAGYINNIENGVNFPSMTVFFYICDYLGITPKEFFDTDSTAPEKVAELIHAASKLDSELLENLTAIAKALNK